MLRIRGRETSSGSASLKRSKHTETCATDRSSEPASRHPASQDNYRGISSNTFRGLMTPPSPDDPKKGATANHVPSFPEGGKLQGALGHSLRLDLFECDISKMLNVG